MRVVYRCLVVYALLLAPLPALAQEAPPARLIVTFKPGVGAAREAALHAGAGGRVVKEIVAGRVKVVDVAAERRDAAIRAYRAAPEVRAVEPDRVRRAALVPGDPRFAEQWALARVGAPAAWDDATGALTPGGQEIVIAVIDCGVFDEHSGRLAADGQAGHPDLRGKVVAAVDFSGAPAQPGSAATDDRCGHGTHVAGIAAAATNNGLGVAGMGRDARVLNLKVLGDDGFGRESDEVAAIRYAADRGAKVINLSLGAVGACSVAEQDAVDYAWTKGALVVAAAGNSAAAGAEAPGNCDRVIAVAATGSADEIASFSNRGLGVAVGAPGVGLLSTWHARDGDGEYASRSGTSMATPMVTGLAALVWSTPWGTGPQAVADRIRDTAAPIAGTGELWRCGRVDAALAVGRAPATPCPAVPSPVPLVADGLEPDDTPASARPLGLDGTPVEHSLHATGDEDWHALALAAGQALRLTTRGQCDTYLYLYGANGATVVAEDDDAGRPLEESAIDYVAPAAGTYYARVRHFAATGTCASYQVVALAYDADAFEPDDAPAQARPLVPGEAPQRRSLHAPGDRDWAAVRLIAGQRVRLFAASASCDTYLYLLAPDGATVLAEDDDGGPGLDSVLEHTVAAGGTYYARVEHYDRGEGTCASYALGATATLRVALSPGWNLIAAPVAPAGGLVAGDLAALAEGDGAPSSVLRWRAGGWQAHDLTPGDGPGWELAPGEGYFVRARGGATLALPGPPSGPAPIALRNGWNLVAVAAPPQAGYDADDLAAAIHAATGARVDLIARWQGGSWRVHAPLAPDGQNWPLAPGAGYLVRVRGLPAPTTFTP